MSVEDNKKLVRRYFEDAPYNPAACDEIFAPRFSFHTIQHASITPQVTESNSQSQKEAFKWLQSVWSPDWRMSLDELIAENDRVMARWTFHGKHQGEFAGLPPTNKQVTYSGINIFRIADSKIAEIWDIFDRLWMWQQLGVFPETKDAIARVKEVMLSRPNETTE
jgi:predicted ester cyclase